MAGPNGGAGTGTNDGPEPAADAERDRLTGRSRGLDALGPLPCRARLGHGPGGLQPGRRAWEYLPHEHARSVAYRWNEDGMAGVCDEQQRLCLALALWNGHDPILKERMFGLTGPEGHHGEDVKEYWWYADAVPSHAWLRWQYAYPLDGYPVPADWSPRTPAGGLGHAGPQAALPEYD